MNIEPLSAETVSEIASSIDSLVTFEDALVLIEALVVMTLKRNPETAAENFNVLFNRVHAHITGGWVKAESVSTLH